MGKLGRAWVEAWVVDGGVCMGGCKAGLLHGILLLTFNKIENTLLCWMLQSISRILACANVVIQGLTFDHHVPHSLRNEACQFDPNVKEASPKVSVKCHRILQLKNVDIS